MPMPKRLLITAYHYDSAYSMESRLAWQRAQHAAAEYDVTVLCQENSWPTPRGADEAAVETVAVPHTSFERMLMCSAATYYLGYRSWQRRLYRKAARLHAERRFDLVHHVSFCGYREPGFCWRLDAPFVWGPVGGTPQFPTAFLGELDVASAAKEMLRNVANFCQLRLDSRIRQAARRASAVLAANRQVAADVQRFFGVTPQVQLETGVAPVRELPREPRDPAAPLKILWAGRLRPWKALPLLLKALAQLPPDCKWVLRVLGEGPCEARWRHLAERLGIASHIEWAGWSPPLADQLPHYDWADVFAFTSLRDTSGTGLLEALAAGAPIIGLDHQGAADVMTDWCAVRVPATTPASAIAGFRDAVERLSTDHAQLAQLSAAAIERARLFTWQRQWEATREIYAEAKTQAMPELRTETATREPNQVISSAQHGVLC